MPQETNLNVSPYFDDFDSSKNFYKVLFKPGYPIQARELTTLQSILQNQIEKFGNHVFKEGSVVIPGQINYNNQFFAVKIESEFAGIPVNFYLKDLVGKTIKGDISKIRAKIIYVLDLNESENDSVTLFVSYLGSGISGESVFIDGETLNIEETITKENFIIQSGSGFANTITVNSTAVGSAVILSEGVYYIRGTFVNVSPQVLILDAYSNFPSYQVGFNISEELVSSDEDPSLNDNAQGFSNYAAPGADRLKITATLVKKPLESTNNESFIHLLEVREGVLVSTKSKPDYSIFQEELARRTYDESGDYYVKPFSLSAKESLNNNIGNSGIFKEGQLTYNGNVPSESLGVYKISPGKAYVKGYEVDVPSTIFVDFEKPRTTKTLENQEVTYLTGSTYTLNRVYGSPELNLGSPFIVSLRDQRVGTSQTVGSGKEIGLARVYDFALESGSYNTDNPNLNEWDLSLFDIQTYTEITLNEPINLTTPVHIKGKSSGATGYLRFNVSNSGIVTAYNINGKFSAGEKFIFNGLENDSRIATSVTDYTNKDVKSISQLSSSNTIFTGDIKPIVSDNVGAAGISSISSGISTVTIALDSEFTFTSIAKVGNLISYTKPGDTVRTFSRINSVSDKSLVISGITTVTGICEGSLPNQNIQVLNLSLLKSEFQPAPDNTLYTILPRPFISSVNLENSSIIIRKEFPISITNGQSSTITAGDNETFLTFDEERYILVRSNGSFEPLTQDRFVFTNGSKELTILGLGPNDANCRLIATLRKSKVKSKIKNKNRIKTLVINKSKYEYSGIGSTTINDGLSYDPSFYGTRVQDEEICLLHPDVTRIYGVFESSSTEDPILSSLDLSIINSPTNTTKDLLVGEEFIGKTSGAVAIYVSRNNDLKIEFSYLNDKNFQDNEIIRFKESGVECTIQRVNLGNKNILNNYKFDYGQRDTIYDYGKLIRNVDVKEPTKKLKVVFETASYSSSDDGDITTVDSYKQFDYCTVTFAKENINNTDIIDIRPKVTELNGQVLTRSPFEFLGRSFNENGNSSKNILASDESILLTYSYYLPRIDRIFLTRDGVFQLNKGEPSEIPQPPPGIDDALEVANISVPPYLCDASRVTINLLKHKRYQMKDIGKLEDRVKTLETYTTLNLLEVNTENLRIKDANGLDRFKSGFFVDNFTNTNSQNKSTIIKNSIDLNNGELRPSPYTTELDLLIGSASLVGIGTSADPTADSKYVTDLVGNNIKRTGQLITLDYSDVVQVRQPFATRVENVTPFLVTRYNGTIELYPSSDTWVDQVRIDAKQVEIDNFTSTQQQLIAQGWDPQTGYSPITWGAWETTWTGSTTSYQTYYSNYWNYWYGYGYPYYYGWYGYPYYYGYWGHYYGWWGYGYPYYYYGYPWYWYGGWGVATTVATTTKTGVSTREGTQFKLTEQVDVQSLGDSVVSTNFISYMRSRNVEFTGRRFKPFTQVYGFFDGEDVNSFIIPKLLEVSMSSGVFQVGETVSASMSTNLENSTPGITITQFVFRLAKSNHRYGPYNNPTDVFTANPYNSEITTPLPEDYSATTELLNVDTYSLSEQAQGTYYGYPSVGMVLRGQTSGAEAVVTNVRLFTDNVGTVIGSFFIPNPNVPTNPTFETGTKTFRLTSSPVNSQIDGFTATSGEQDYYAMGTLETIQETIVSTRTAKIDSEKVTESKEVSETTTSVSSNVHGWYGWPYSWRYRYGRWGYCYWDPLAQSFFVEEESGIFVTKLDLYFQTKDKEIPVAIQMRSMSNGVPTTEIYPFSEIILEPKDINLSEDGSVATTVTFPSPVYLKGGKEHAIVILSESNEYNVWISRLGEVDVTTLSQPESQQIVVTQQTLLGSLFKSQNGSTWDASQYEDLKFTLYRADFNTEPGDVNFYNPELNFGNKHIANLVPNSLNLNSRLLRIGLSNIIDDANLVLGNTILQEDSSVSGNYVGFAGSSFGNLNLVNTGVGYSDGYYQNVPLINLTGTGRNATANITITNGEVVSLGATVSSGGSGYRIGDVLTVGGNLANIGRNMRLSVSQINGVNQIIVDNVQGEFTVGNNKAVKFVGDSGTFNINGLNGDLFVDFVETDTEESDGLHIKVNHKNHGMHSTTNIVTISDVRSDIDPVTLSSNYEVNTTNAIALVGDSQFINDIFGTFENIPVSSENPGYILIDREIISYEGVVNNTLIGITREIDQTKSFTYPQGTFAFKYELNGVSLRRINKDHNLQDSTISRSVDLDYYYIKLDMSSSNKGTISENGPNGQIDRSVNGAIPKLYMNETKTSGGYNILATQNIQFEVVKPILQTMNLTNTRLTGRIRTISGTSVDGSEASFLDQGFQTISLDENSYLSSPRIIASKVNETAKLSTLPGNKSFTFNLTLNTSDPLISPVIDLDRVGMIFTSNRINSPIDNYITDFRISTVKDDPSAFVYACNPISLGVPASSIKIILSAYVNKFSDIRALYSIMKESNEESIYYPFPGFNNLIKSGQVIDISQSDGTSDLKVEKTDGVGFLSNELSYRDYEFTIDNLPDFRFFSIKLIGSSTNQSYPPRIRSLRVIALA